MNTALKDKLSWFGSEFLVVVVGVLVALTLSSYWQGIKDRDTESAYLDQVTAELQSSITQLHADSVKTYASQLAVANLLRSYRTQEKPPPDSLAKWLSGAFVFDVNGISIGTLEAIISSDDFQLIRSDSLRANFPVFLNEAKTLNTGTFMMGEGFLRAFEKVTPFIDRPGLFQLTQSDSLVSSVAIGNPLFWLPPDAKEIWLGLPIDEMLSNKELYSAFTLMMAQFNSMRRNRNTSLRVSRELVALIERERD